MPQDLFALIAKLQAWKEHDFHADRQLADEVLIADGWRCESDAGFSGGIRWFVGKNPQYSCSEEQRPHVINDLNTALGVVPAKHNVMLTIAGKEDVSLTSAHVWPQRETFSEKYEGVSQLPTIAVLIAALKAKQALQAKEAP